MLFLGPFKSMKDKKTTILGIDPGTRITGYGIVQYSSHSVVPIDFGCIRPPLSASLNEKYAYIFRGVNELLDRYEIEHFSTETQFLGKNIQSTIKVSMARAVSILPASNRLIPVFEYSPKKAKLAVTGNGQASKSQVQKMIQVLLSLKTLPTPEDASDALALALCHAHTLNKERKNV